jgi:pimeloyl-ACP methyl ester carboxylesterase
MGRLRHRVIAAAAALLVQLEPAAAASERAVLADGTAIDYLVALPAGYDPARSYPMILAFPGGRQTADDATRLLDRFFAFAGPDRGVVTVVPIAPGVSRKFYFDFGEPTIDEIPEFVRLMRQRYAVAGDTIHLAGHSNGAVSAFRAAIRFPELFASMTALAGSPVEPEDWDRLDRLRGLRITLVVGRNDPEWADRVIGAKQVLDGLGIPARLEVLRLNGHLLSDLSFEKSGRVMDLILGAEAK